jgi:hypothetical protein
LSAAPFVAEALDTTGDPSTSKAVASDDISWCAHDACTGTPARSLLSFPTRKRSGRVTTLLSSEGEISHVSFGPMQSSARSSDGNSGANAIPRLRYGDSMPRMADARPGAGPVKPGPALDAYGLAGVDLDRRDRGVGSGTALVEEAAGQELSRTIHFPRK